MADVSTSTTTLQPPPAGYSVRSATMDDVGPVLEMLTETDLHDWGSPDMTENELRFQWRLPGLDLGRDVWLVHAEDGALAGYGWIFARGEEQQMRGWAVVHPDHRGRGVGAHLVRLRMDAAAVHTRQAPRGAQVFDRMEVIAPDAAAHDLARRFGYEEVRHFWLMLTELTGPVSEAPHDHGLVVRPMDAGTEPERVYGVFEESFKDHWGHVQLPQDEWTKLLAEDPQYDPSLWFVAVERSGGEERIGGALRGSIDEGEGYVDTLGVLAPWRGRGVGESLLRRSFADFARRGIRTVKLYVDSENATGATRLYERVGMHVHRQYDVFEREASRAG
jgi:mycothiol synthase